MDALEDFGHRLPQLLPNFKFYYIALHVDLANPHLQVGAVPFYLIDEQNNKTNKSQLIKHQSGVSNAFIRTAEELDLPIARNKQGKPIATSAFKLVMNDYLKGHLLESYRIAKNDHTIERAQTRPKRENLSVQEYRKLVQPINDIAQEMAQLLIELGDTKSSLEALYERLDNEQRDNAGVTCGNIEKIHKKYEDILMKFANIQITPNASNDDETVD